MFYVSSSSQRNTTEVAIPNISFVFTIGAPVLGLLN